MGESIRFELLEPRVFLSAAGRGGGGRAAVAFGERVVRAATTVSVPALAASYLFDQSVAIAAVLKPGGPSNGPFSGVATIIDQDNAVLGTAQASGNGQLKFTLGVIAPGVHIARIHYVGDTLHSAAVSAAFTLRINPLPTTTLLKISASSVTAGQPLTLVATVAANIAMARTGTVTFKDGEMVLGTAMVGKNSTATITIRPKTGRHNFTAFYSPATSVLSGSYSVTNLVSDSSALIPAKLEDPNLINPWGISFGDNSTGFWLSDNNAGASTAYVLDSNGNPHEDLLIGVPAPGPSAGGTPTGTVFNPDSSSFMVNGHSSAFLFDTEDGTISAWTPGSSNAEIVIDNSAAGAVYKGLALATTAQGDRLYAANFNTGTIDVFDSNFNPVVDPTAFVDPNNPLPPGPRKVGYAPFNVQNIDGKLYVTYALQDAQQHDDFSGPGKGFVDVFSTSGAFLKRLINPGGVLDSPWGLALAPKSFGQFGGDLLVGNFGNSRINAFDPTTGAFQGTLEDSSGKPILLSNATDVPGLWGLAFGNGVGGFDPNTLYFSSGDNAQFDGLFGAVNASSAPVALFRGSSSNSQGEIVSG